MSMREREGLIARIRQIRRAAPAAEKPSETSSANPDLDELQHLEARIAHLEQLVEGLQDSVHRESERQGRLIAELEARIEPGAMSAALSKDARERGL
jgi:small-conductance mechanosensitive channel